MKGFVEVWVYVFTIALYNKCCEDCRSVSSLSHNCGIRYLAEEDDPVDFLRDNSEKVLQASSLRFTFAKSTQVGHAE